MVDDNGTVRGFQQVVDVAGQALALWVPIRERDFDFRSLKGDGDAEVRIQGFEVSLEGAEDVSRGDDAGQVESVEDGGGLGLGH